MFHSKKKNMTICIAAGFGHGIAIDYAHLMWLLLYALEQIISDFDGFMSINVFRYLCVFMLFYCIMY